MSVVRTVIDDNRFSIIKPVICDPSTEIIITESLQEFRDWIDSSEVQEADIVAFDTETKGTDLHSAEFQCVGIGLSIGEKSIYLGTKDKDFEEIAEAFEAMRELPLIAHNLYYDSKVVSYYLGTVRGNALCTGPGWINYQFCTFGLLKQLANEDFVGQQWGLKWAEKNILGWKETNEIERDEWLVAHGYITAKARLPKLDTPEKRLAAFNERDKKGKRKLSADPSEMWRVPKDILGKYCALDALACWQLFKFIFEPAFDRIPAETFIDWHQIDFLTWVRIHVDAYFHGGILIDSEDLSLTAKELESQIKNKERELRSHPQIKPHVEKYEDNLYEEYISSAPSMYRIHKEAKEPPRKTKSGKLSKSWFNWYFRCKWISTPGTISKSWVKWNRKRREILKGENPDYRFNFGSGNQLKYLIYDCNYPYEVVREHSEKKRGRIRLKHNGLELDMTEKGGIPTGKQALKAIGGFCKEIDALAILRGELQFCKAYLNRASLSPESMVYPDVRIPGTTTGRASAGDDKESGSKNSYKFNHLNPPKKEKILKTWLPKPGFDLWTSDVSGLESVVVTELSRDEGMMGVWGPDAKPNDLYIYTASQLGALGKCFVDEGYDPKNPDLELVAKLKKKYKKERGIAKVLVLAGNYGASAYKMWSTLRLDGVDVTLKEVEGYHKAFWDLYSGIKDLEDDLRVDYESRKWFINGSGRPMCVSERKLKDLCNIMVQSTGHDCLMKALRILYFKVEEKGWGPDRFGFFIPDYHDETDIMTCNIKKSEVRRLLQEMQTELNEELGGLIPLKFETDKINTFWDAKKG